MNLLCRECSRKPLVSLGCSASAPATAAGQVVDDQILGDAAEEGPGRLQSVDDVFQFLAEGGPDKTELSLMLL